MRSELEEKDKLQNVYLPWWPKHSKPYHWLPRQGKAMSIVERIVQNIIKIIAWYPVYIAIFFTLTLGILFLEVYE